MRKIIALALLLSLALTLCSCSLTKSEPITVEDGTNYGQNTIIIDDDNEDEDKNAKDEPITDPEPIDDKVVFGDTNDIVVTLASDTKVFYESADAESTVAVTLAKDIEIIRNGKNDEWSRVVYQGQTGYIRNSDIKVTFEKSSGTVVPKGTSLNLRAKASTASERVANVPAGQQLSVIRKSTSAIVDGTSNLYWYIVEYDGKECYAREDVIKFVEDNT